MRARALLVTLLLGQGLATVASAHHVGVFVPKDDNITKNFKEIKFAAQARRFDLALKLFDDGIVHATMEKNERRLPRGLEDGLRAVLRGRDVAGAELRLAIFLVFMTRERLGEALNRVRAPEIPPGRRREQARKLVNGAWRYYNLVDFAVTAHDPKAGVALRIGFEDALTFLGGMMIDPMWAGATNAKPADPDDARAARVLSGMLADATTFIARAARTADRGDAKRFLPR